MNHYLLHSGTLIKADETIEGDILFGDGKMKAIGKNLKVPADTKKLDVSGKMVLPGGIDPHVHLELPMGTTISSDDFFTGTRAAAFGGTTTVIDFASQDTAPLWVNIENARAKADPKVAVDYSLHMDICRWNAEVKEQIPQLVPYGVTSLKVFTAYRHLKLSDPAILQVLRTAGEAGMLTMAHCESGDVIDLLVAEALRNGNTKPIWHARTRPAWGAVEATLRVSALAAQAGAPVYIVHVNAGGEVDQIQYMRGKGVSVMAETCPQYLLFTEEELKRVDGAKFVCSPPLRTKEDSARLWEGLIEGSLQVLATDHCPFCFQGQTGVEYDGKWYRSPGKELGEADFSKIPNGLPGIEDRLPVFWTTAVKSGKITPNQFVAITSTNPAKIFGMYPQKGELKVGSDADLVVWDPKKRLDYGIESSHQRVDYNLYQGLKVTGMPTQVFLRGNLIVDDGKWLGKAGMGKFVFRKAKGMQL